MAALNIKIKLKSLFCCRCQQLRRVLPTAQASEALLIECGISVSLGKDTNITATGPGQRVLKANGAGTKLTINGGDYSADNGGDGIQIDNGAVATVVGAKVMTAGSVTTGTGPLKKTRVVLVWKSLP